jgi:hypothetical protein
MAKKKPTFGLRKPPPIQAEPDMASFVAGKTAGKPGESDKPKPVTVYLSPMLFKKAKVAAIYTEQTFSDFVAAALEVAVAKHTSEG